MSSSAPRAGAWSKDFKLHEIYSRLGRFLPPAMKQALLELMRMSRICRMVLATCLGSFVLVIFYFQSMFQPVMRRNPFATEACCPKGSHNALQELYNPTQAEFSGASFLHQARRDQVAEACRALGPPGAPPRLTPATCATWWWTTSTSCCARARQPQDPRPVQRPEINHRLNSFLKFLFVREPFERLVSAYRNKFTLKALRSGADVRFPEFARYLADPATRRDGPLNEHWAPVHSLCHPCHLRYDLVGKYEALEDDANYLLRLAGVAPRLRFPSFAKSTRTTDQMAAAFFHNVSAQQQALLYQLYRLDFLMFNYSMPSYLQLH
ncbi:hypothetical protein ANANG_G00314730 [Anguilla anguilla]|uniref:Carbohydrate sulfotransferase n=1 Tax=Anguilla anguilla TaxID=7936 RepID=A0A9D3LKZ9_ANGAN|nr:hypothetical protein ANANG_G00314730 [Anguilla anguilla]